MSMVDSERTDRLNEQRGLIHRHLNRASNVVAARLGDRDRLGAMAIQRMDAGMEVYGDVSFWKAEKLLLQDLDEELADALFYAALLVRLRTGG